MEINQLKVAVLFPLRSHKEALMALSEDRPIDFCWTPYLESSELRSSRGHNRGLNVENLEEPEIPSEYLEQWQGCNAIVSMDLPSNPKNLFPEAQWFQGVSAGYDHIDADALAEMGVQQTSSRGIASSAISEFVFARLLQELKHLRKLDDQQERKEWEVQFGNQAEGRTIGIVGLGSIGTEIAKKAKVFGMNVLACKRNVEDASAVSLVDHLFPSQDVTTMLPLCDVVVMAAPATRETENMFDQELFSLMKEGSIFINIARGTHVVEENLIAYLRTGHLRAAILDVVRNEPLTKEDPLWNAPNLYLSPHCSVSFDTYEANAIRLISDNALRLLSGENLINLV
ncbi:MAG: D-2-hydroxyacid dehydrogenase [Acidimicrobiales bacterium]|jgi:phosphoglycerate dehydrogenase-like enzyme|nr:D-2-hydroxyacid dehydrogenase [Acidimicrobiales bacterium]HJM97242.1 D-2-hydroxyacid dehydrogenase [Acidimicrobiales bacterium]